MEEPYERVSEDERQRCTIRAFWLGKELISCEDTVIRKELSVLLAWKETALSPRVYQKVSRPPNSLVESGGEDGSGVANEQGLVVWRNVGLLLDEYKGEEEIKFEAIIKRLFPVCQVVHRKITEQLSEREFEENYAAKLEWTGCAKRYLECHKLLKGGNPVDLILSLLLITSSFEHALGDVYVTYSHAPCCPSLLKDLLSTKELEEVFGRAAVSLLRVLIGPPTGLNLRNVLWHGFAAPGEVPPEYGSMLLSLLISLDENFEATTFHQRNIERRPLLPFHGSENLDGIFPELRPEHVPEIKRLLPLSIFVLPSMLPTWIKAVEYFGQGRYDFSTVLLFPLLEHGLRRVFTCVNSCPRRLLTAEATVLYTTFDEILAANLPNGSLNALRGELGDPFFEMLQDLLVHPDGPRLRDHISHGQVDVSMLPRALANHVLCVCLGLVFLYLIPDKNFDAGRHGRLIQQISDAARGYKSVFHPISVLKMDTKTLLDSLSSCHELPKPDMEHLAFPTESSPFVMQTKYLKLLAGTVEGDLRSRLESLLPTRQEFVKFITSLLDEPMSLLFRPRSEMELVSLFRNIVLHCQMTVHQVLEAAKSRYEQWERRELRSRQRANYRRLWEHVPSVLGSVHVVVVMVTIQLTRLSADSHGSRAAYLRFLKRILKFTENMETLSSAAKNRWEECGAMATKLVEAVEEYYSTPAVPQNQTAEPLVSPIDVVQHSSREDAWIIIDGKVYDVTSYVTAHPGGEAILRNVGGDASEGFHDQRAHGVVRKHISRLLDQYLVGGLAEDVAKS